MARRSKVTALPGPIKQAVDELLKTGRFTLDAIVAHLRKLADEHGVEPADLPSRSAVGRYMKNFERVASRMREAREMASALVANLGEASEDKVGTMVTQMMQRVIFDYLLRVDDGDGVTPEDVMLLSKGIHHLHAGLKSSADRELKVREAARRDAASAVDKIAKAQGLTAATVEAIKASILGLPAPSAKSP